MPIEDDRIEIGYLGGKLIYFHHMRCPRFAGTNCVLEYHKKIGGVLDLLSTTRADLEQTTESELIGLLQSRQLRFLIETLLKNSAEQRNS